MFKQEMHDKRPFNDMGDKGENNNNYSGYRHNKLRVKTNLFLVTDATNKGKL